MGAAPRCSGTARLPAPAPVLRGNRHARRQGPPSPHPHPRVGRRPAALAAEPTGRRGTCLSRVCAESVSLHAQEESRGRRPNAAFHPFATLISVSKILVIAEKPSVARDLAAALPGTFEKTESYLESDEYIVTYAVGHLVELADPKEYDERFK